MSINISSFWHKRAFALFENMSLCLSSWWCINHFFVKQDVLNFSNFDICHYTDYHYHIIHFIIRTKMITLWKNDEIRKSLACNRKACDFRNWYGISHLHLLIVITPSIPITIFERVIHRILQKQTKPKIFPINSIFPIKCSNCQHSNNNRQLKRIQGFLLFRRIISFSFEISRYKLIYNWNGILSQTRYILNFKVIIVIDELIK